MPMLTGTGMPALRALAHEQIDRMNADGIVNHGVALAVLGLDGLLMSGAAQGIIACLASPEWAYGALRAAGAPDDDIAERIAVIRAWMQDHPVGGPQ